MTAPTFRVGDRVRWNGERIPRMEGRVGTVRVLSRDRRLVYVRWDDRRSDQAYYPHDLVPAEAPAP